jgi:hypothetical protein
MLRLADYETEIFKAEKAEFISSIKKDYTDFEAHIIKLKHLSSEQNAKNKSIIEEYKKELECKKNRKFQIRCIQIAKEILNEESIIEYRPPFLNGLELDAFFPKYRIPLKVQGPSIGFIAPAGVKISKNSKTSLIVIGKKDAYVKITESSFLKYGMMKNRKLLFPEESIKFRSLLK